jgi:hypothetical protein
MGALSLRSEDGVIFRRFQRRNIETSLSGVNRRMTQVELHPFFLEGQLWQGGPISPKRSVYA